MATTVTNPDKLKFLDITGLTALVEKIKTLVNGAIDSSKVESMTYDSENRTFKVTQQGDTYVTSDAIPVASGGAAGLMSSEQLATLNDVKSNKIDKVALRIDSKQDATLFSSSTINGEKVTVIDYTTDLANEQTKNQAPTAGAVNTALSKKLDIVDYETEKETFATKTEVSEQFTELEESIANDYYTKTEVDGIKSDLNTAIGNKLDSSEFNTFKNGYDSAHEALTNNVSGLSQTLTSLTTFTGTINADKSANVYNKTEVDEALASLETKILGGDRDQINDTYETLKGIADWITNDATGATGLANQVAANSSAIETNKSDISNLKTTVGDSDNGLVKDVADLKTTVGDSNSGLVKAVADLANKDTEIENDIADLGTAIGTETTGLTGRVASLETGAESLGNRLTTLEQDKDSYATKSDAVGSFGVFKRNATSGNLELEVINVNGDALTPITFEVFTEADINALFED